MPKIFISYRRESTTSETGRIYDRLSDRFGEDNIFMDLDSIPLGVDFRRHLETSLQICDVLLVIIGPNWVGRRPGTDTTRINDPSDFVRLEVQVALKKDIPVIPVLIGNTSMPLHDDLPEEIRPLIYRQAITVNMGQDFRHHMQRLVAGIGVLRATPPPPLPTPSPDPPPPVIRDPNKNLANISFGLGVLSIACGLAGIPAIVLGLIANKRGGKNPDEYGGRGLALSGITLGFIATFGWVFFGLLSMDFDRKLSQYFDESPPSNSNSNLSYTNINSNTGANSNLNSAPGNREIANNNRAATNQPQPLPKSTEMELVRIPAGSFMMGSNEHKSYMPMHRVTFANEFYMGKYEVTQAQYRAVMGNNPSFFSGCDDCPVEKVSWHDVKEFCRKLTQTTGREYRLPSEAEWEYAARAGTTGSYTGNLDAIAWHSRNSGGKTHPVGQKRANGWGLYDMQGNVYELVEDIYHKDYNGAPSDGSAWLTGGEGYHSDTCILRGGSWYMGARDADSLTGRNWASRGSVFDHHGFRVASSSGQ